MLDTPFSMILHCYNMKKRKTQWEKMKRLVEGLDSVLKTKNAQCFPKIDFKGTQVVGARSSSGIASVALHT